MYHCLLGATLVQETQLIFINWVTKVIENLEVVIQTKLSFNAPSKLS